MTTDRKDIDQLERMFRRPVGPGPVRPEEDPAPRRRRRIRGLVIALVVILALGGTAGGYAYAALSAPLPRPTLSAQPPTVAAGAAAAIITPEAGEFAVSVQGADGYLGAGAATAFASSGGNAAVPMASISKLVTALVILDAKPLGASGTGPTITFSKADHDLYDAYYSKGATIALMPTGSRMTEHDAIETMLVVSASNYADAMSTWAFGSSAGFLAATRTWLAAHGLNSTRLVEPTGLDPRNVSTPSDLLALGKLALADPAIASIVSMKTLDVPGLPNQLATNDLLGADGVDGIKTGTLGKLNNLLFSATTSVAGLTEPLRIIGVELGAPTHDQTHVDVDSFVQSLADGFHPVAVAKDGTVIGTATTPWGARSSVRLDADASLETWSSTPVSVRMSALALGRGKAGERVGTLTYTAGSQHASVPLILTRTIRPPDAWWRLTHPHQVLGW